MASFRIIQRDSLFYPQTKKIFIWFYLTKNKVEGMNSDCIFDIDGALCFKTMAKSKKYINKLINKRAKVVYTIDENG